MNFSYAFNLVLVGFLVALLLLLIWSAIFGIYLNRIHSRGWDSTKRLLKTYWGVGPLALLVSIFALDDGLAWDYLRGVLGHGPAQMRLAQEYGKGDRLLARALPRSLYWVRRAADNGDVQAQFAAAQLELSGQAGLADPVRALAHARSAAASGHAEAMVLVGQILLQHGRLAQPGENPATHFIRAIPLLEAQSRQGNADALFSLGLLYLRGQGVERDIARGLGLLLRAQSKGLSPSRYLFVEEIKQEANTQTLCQANDLALTPW